MYCTNCGHLLNVTDKFCSECGTAVKYTPLPKKDIPEIGNMSMFYTIGNVPMRAFLYYSLMNLANKDPNKK